MPCDRVELVVSHNRLCGSSVNHPAHGHDAFQLLGSAIDKVAYEQRAAIRMPVGAVPIYIAKLV